MGLQDSIAYMVPTDLPVARQGSNTLHGEQLATEASYVRTNSNAAPIVKDLEDAPPATLGRFVQKQGADERLFGE